MFRGRVQQVAWILCTVCLPAGAVADDAQPFRQQIAPLLAHHCLQCHGGKATEGGLDLTRREGLVHGGDSGPAVVPGDPDGSLLIDYVSGQPPEMPKTGDPLKPVEITRLREWIRRGAVWPEGLVLRLDPRDWWSLRPLVKPPFPAVSDEDAAWTRNPVDRFIVAALRQAGLSPSPEADRPTLIRRLYYDLIGLPPTPDAVAAFASDPDPLAYERLVDRLLASPHYGERWARHWLDVVHYGDTHGYDKDKPRENAWPYRDYVIRAMNADRPYARFVREQLAGDVFYPGTPDGLVATGFISAGPWDFIGHVELPESKLDGAIARNLDRDDMVTTTMNTFVSVTVQCARCHNHKFDPVTRADYYSLQAVFAALDRADRPYDPDPRVAARRYALGQKQHLLAERKQQLEAETYARAGPELSQIDKQLAQLRSASRKDDPAFGYHSQIEPRPDRVKWVQVDLGRPMPIREIVYVACHDDFNHIGDGFGFPVRYRMEASDSPDFSGTPTTLLDRTAADTANPGVVPQVIQLSGVTARYVRFTATRLALRQNDYIFALGELIVRTEDGTNVAAGAPVTALDSIEAPVRWQRANLVDGYFYGVPPDAERQRQCELLSERRARLLNAALDDRLAAEYHQVESELSGVQQELAQLPLPRLVYAGCVHNGSGNFAGTGPNGGRPREIHILERGDMRRPGELVGPGTIPVCDELPSRFAIPDNAPEGARRAALADWIVDQRNPLTWRSIVNRIWQYHFERAIVESPNDFGHMGREPSHPELLDWLAATFRDDGESIKDLHRMLVTSATYRQSSAERPEAAEVDADNHWLWRMNRQRLDAEAIRDSILSVSELLDPAMYGPGFQDFVLEKPEHSPHYEYQKFDPADPRVHRRAIYRFLVRSQQEPFMQTLDCADPSMSVEKRHETLSPLQSLVLLNDHLVLLACQHMAEALRAAEPTLDEQVDTAFQRVLLRAPRPQERQALQAYTRRFGLENTCRVLLNLNEFVFVE